MKTPVLETTSSESSASAWGALGSALFVVGKNELAVEALETALRKARPDQDGRIEWLLDLGKALLELGHVERSCEAFGDALDLEEAERGFIDADELPPEAFYLLRTAADRQEGVIPDRPLPRWGGPKDSLSWTQLGWAFGQVYADAHAIERFVRLLTDDASLHLYAWYALYQSYSDGNPSLAIAALERAVVSYPEDVEVYGRPSLPELIEELSASCLLNNEVDKAVAWSRQLFEVMRQRRERNAGRNESRYRFVGDVHMGEVVRIEAHHVVVKTWRDGELSLPVEDFKNDSGEVEIEIGDVAQVAVVSITAPAGVVHMDSAHVSVLVGPSLIVSNIPIEKFRTEQDEIWVKMGDSIQIIVDETEEGRDDNNPMFIHQDTADMQLSFRRVIQGSQ